ncbi:hypothetical protein ACHAWF_004407 [Thalassiosira exigua]
MTRTTPPRSSRRKRRNAAALLGTIALSASSSPPSAPSPGAVASAWSLLPPRSSPPPRRRSRSVPRPRPHSPPLPSSSSSSSHPLGRASPAALRESLRASVARGGGGRNDEVLRDSAAAPPSSPSDALLARARRCLDLNDAEGAFVALAEAHGIDPTDPRLSSIFEACLRLKVTLGEGRRRRERKVGPDGRTADRSERELSELFQDRMGLASLLVDGERYDEAGEQLRKAIGEVEDRPSRSADDDRLRWRPQLDRARYLLHRSDAACCRWDDYVEDGEELRESVLRDPSARLLHPFDALKFPCISLETASEVARSYARRALEAVGAEVEAEAVGEGTVPRRSVAVDAREATLRPPFRGRKLRVGYVSPDFTSKHPLAFLMQHVFRRHDEERFEVYIYSLSSREDDGPEVRAIREGSDAFRTLSPSAMSPVQMYEKMLEDELDVIVDLCGYAGTSVAAEVMASRCKLQQEQQKNRQFDRQQPQSEGGRRFPIHVSYMGFPGSVGSSRVWDYSVFDRTAVPPEDEFDVRRHYDEALAYMPHCYFVNSHKTVVGDAGDGILPANEAERRALRTKYGLDPDAFVCCCHSRPDKIDPSTFRTWTRALLRVRSIAAAAAKGEGEGTAPREPILWLLRSGEEMESNLRRLVRTECGGPDAEALLAFADVTDRDEHLRRLAVADVFLDTPAYGAHTLGCDALYAGVPMISLLRPLERRGLLREGPHATAEEEPGFVATEKLASRVGASLLRAVGLDDLIAPDLGGYEDAMVRCASDDRWFEGVRDRLLANRDEAPLFDTDRWVRNFEAALREMAELGKADDGAEFPDIFVEDGS